MMTLTSVWGFLLSNGGPALLLTVLVLCCCCCYCRASLKRAFCWCCCAACGRRSPNYAMQAPVAPPLWQPGVPHGMLPPPISAPLEPTKMELCTEEGFLRGEHLAREFGPHGPYPMPNRLFARKLNPGVYTSRDLYLLWPLAQKLGLRVNTSFGEETPEDAMTMVQSIEREREVKCLEGHSLETVLVSWDHCSIPALAQAWGCRQEPCMRCWDDGDFEKLLWLRFTATPAAADPREALSWNLTVAAVSEDFSAPRGVSGYRECLGNPAESSNYGFPCRAPPSWKSLSPNLTGRHGHQ
eukprot:g3609.t1